MEACTPAPSASPAPESLRRSLRQLAGNLFDYLFLALAAWTLGEHFLG